MTARLPRRAELIVTGRPGQLQSRLPVEAVAVAAVGVALLAASALGEQRGWPTARLSLDRGHVSDAVRSERYFRRSDQPAGISFAPFSRFWRTADGWVRTHANYPWHRQALLAALGVDLSGRAKDDDVAGQLVAAAAARRAAEELQEAVVAAGGVAAAVRTPGGWQIHPQGQAVAAEPLIGYRAAGRSPGPAAVRRRSPGRRHPGARSDPGNRRSGVHPLPGRPGRRGASHRPAPPARYGRRGRFRTRSSANAAPSWIWTRPAGRKPCIVCSTAPTSSSTATGPVPSNASAWVRNGLAGRHPGLVVVQLDAWGHDGPWSRRRGFDSIVQAACGIAATEVRIRRHARRPPLPAPRPWHRLSGRGRGALDGLRRQERSGRLRDPNPVAGPDRDVAHQARSGPPPRSGRSTPVTPTLASRLDRSGWSMSRPPIGLATAVAPPGRLDGRPLTWPSMAGGYGAAPPAWAPG